MKACIDEALSYRALPVSIPSRGFWFFEVQLTSFVDCSIAYEFQSPRGDFGFLKGVNYGSEIRMVCPFQSPRGDFGFLKQEAAAAWIGAPLFEFQSPRGDFGFLKAPVGARQSFPPPCVSIPSRGFWFFEVNHEVRTAVNWYNVSIPSRGFWFFEGAPRCGEQCKHLRRFQSPRGDFGFLKSQSALSGQNTLLSFQSPRGDFGFLKPETRAGWCTTRKPVSIPSRGFWFFEVSGGGLCIR